MRYIENPKDFVFRKNLLQSQNHRKPRCRHRNFTKPLQKGLYAICRKWKISRHVLVAAKLVAAAAAAGDGERGDSALSIVRKTGLVGFLGFPHCIFFSI